ncbi:MAG: hypothetical protein KF912_01630 [Phycisphaeraceae bacterium]|nr:hypothetical protein [Phycisphaeraceae bacterium]MBX3366000.1 hypothetical protein [Phycisphaeraceae bacterium]
MFAAAALNRLTTVLAILVLATSPVFAKASSQPVDEAFLAWWRTITSTEKMAEMYEGISIRFAVTYGEQKGPVSEIDRGTPEAPIIQSQIWRSGNSWRFNREPPFAGIEYDDAVWASGLAWRLNNQQLLIDDQAGIESSKYRIDLVGNDVAFEFSRLTSCTLDRSFRDAPSTCVPVLNASGQTWTLDCTFPLDGPRGRRVRAEGAWNDAEGWGTIDRMTAFSFVDGQETDREELVASDWSPIPGRTLAAPRRVAHGMTLEAPDPPLVHTVHLLALNTFAPAEFKALTRVPRVDGADVVRGEVRFVQMQDLRKNSQVVHNIDEERRAERVPGNTLPARRSMLRTVAWIAVGIMGAALIALQIRKRLA